MLPEKYYMKTFPWRYFSRKVFLADFLHPSATHPLQLLEEFPEEADGEYFQKNTLDNPGNTFVIQVLLGGETSTSSTSGTHPLQPLEVFPEETDGVVRPGDAELDNALLQDLLDVCNTNLT